VVDQPGSFATDPRHPAADMMSTQEHYGALMIPDGVTIREAASHLPLSPKTIETHLGRASRELGVHTAKHARARTLEPFAGDVGVDARRVMTPGVRDTSGEQRPEPKLDTCC
jgi:DNA-binding CsgD family transcriptional regulator